MWSLEDSHPTSPPVPAISEDLSTKGSKRKRRKTTKTPLIHTAAPVILPKSSSEVPDSKPHQFARKSLFAPIPVGKSESLAHCASFIQSQSPLLSNPTLTRQAESTLETQADIFSHLGQPVMAASLDIWKGDLNSAFERVLGAGSAASAEEKSAFLALSPILGYSTWQAFVLEQAKRYQKSDNLHLAALFYIAAGQALQGVEMYEQERLFIDALMLARVHLGENHPKVTSLLEELARSAERQGHRPTAGEYFLQLNLPNEAIRCLTQAGDPDELRLALSIASSFAEKEVPIIVSEISLSLLKVGKFYSSEAALCSHKIEEYSFLLVPIVLCASCYSLSKGLPSSSGLSDFFEAPSRVSSTRTNETHPFPALFPKR